MLGIITLVTTREVNVEVFQKKASEGPLKNYHKRSLAQDIPYVLFHRYT